MTDARRLLVVGGTAGIGREVVKHYADRGWSVILTGRDAARAKAIAAEIGGAVRGVALDLSDPEGIASALADIESLDHVVISAIERDLNTVKTTTSGVRPTS